MSSRKSVVSRKSSAVALSSSTSVLNFIVILQVTIIVCHLLCSWTGLTLSYDPAHSFVLAAAQLFGCFPGIFYVFKDCYLFLVHYTVFQVTLTLASLLFGIVGLVDGRTTILAVVILLYVPLNISAAVIATWYFEHGLHPVLVNSALAQLTKRRNIVFKDATRPSPESLCEDPTTATCRSSARSECFQVSSLGDTSSKQTARILAKQEKTRKPQKKERKRDKKRSSKSTNSKKPSSKKTEKDKEPKAACKKGRHEKKTDEKSKKQKSREKNKFCFVPKSVKDQIVVGREH
ncbi:hypothetical protein L596_027927 [Steinernema carpocapsae]|uniref:Uncharacterized protein n=1 Tax=Steinernema carpocapsae TaxID=34508 RepID=A0A4U5LWX9_STECR|nr:hypothetical protein L596_027927 [Steinernema carpocapsae]